MTETYFIQGRRPGILSTIIRTTFLVAAAIGGLFMLAFSAAVAFFAVAGIAVFGFLVFAVFWAKAKITGKPFGPKAMMEAQLDQMRKDVEIQMGAHPAESKATGQASGQGPVVDAHRTPDGWSVDD